MFKLTIITINRNNAAGLRKTIESVVNQTFTDFEYIVIDGASTDDSVNTIKEFVDKIDYWVSEPDNGIYNAMNKGIMKAQGEYCLFLNSGDSFVNKYALRDLFNVKFDADIVSGYVCGIKGNKAINIYPPKDFTFRYLYYNNIPHQSEFIRTSLFKKLGAYSEKYRILGDYDFNIRAISENVSYQYVDILVAFVDLDGISSMESNVKILDEEREQIFQSNLPAAVLKDYLYYLDNRGIAHPAVNWLVQNRFLFRSVKFLYRILS
jgi:glycosyltransferase involved in cell wall biosynthesis